MIFVRPNYLLIHKVFLQNTSWFPTKLQKIKNWKKKKWIKKKERNKVHTKKNSKEKKNSNIFFFIWWMKIRFFVPKHNLQDLFDWQHFWLSLENSTRRIEESENKIPDCYSSCKKRLKSKVFSQHFCCSIMQTTAKFFYVRSWEK